MGPDFSHPATLRNPERTTARRCVYCGVPIDGNQERKGWARRSTACREHGYLLNRDPRYAMHYGPDLNPASHQPRVRDDAS